MKWATLLVFIAGSLACPTMEPTTIQIQNYDGPIFLHIPAQNDEPCTPNYPSHQQAEIECTCIAKPSIKYIPINTASESSCFNRRNYANAGTTCGSYDNEKHCKTCSCGNDHSRSNGGTCESYDNDKHCRTCTCGSNNRGSCSCGVNNSGSCTCGVNNSGSCTCGVNNSEGCTCGVNNSGSCSCGVNNSGGCICGANNSRCCSCASNNSGNCSCGSNNSRSCTCEMNNEGYRGMDKISYTLDIVKPRSYDSGHNNCICHKRQYY